MLHYFDTSVLAKLYMEERGTAPALALAEANLGRLALSSLGFIELRAAIRSRQRAGTLTPGIAEEMLTHFDQAVRQHWLRQPLSEMVFDLAAAYLDRHPLRSPDALQLAACVTLQQLHPVQFVCSDRRLLAAARSEGLAVWDPTATVE